jgi:hypothetical protein
MEKVLDKLKQITREILDPGSSIHTWISSINSLNMIVTKHSPLQINPYKDIGEGRTRLPCGLAISPVQAALCAREISRTAAFIKGLGRAVEAVQSRNPGRPVRVLYAGCGPFALLAFPLMSVFTKDQVRFVLIDIHAESIIPAKALIKSFGFLDYITDFICADASSCQLPFHEKPDIIVTETMNTCLDTEPQVMILLNLFQQAPDALIIPESVKVDAYLLNPAKEFSMVDPGFSGEIPEPVRDRLFLGTVFKLSRETLRKWKIAEKNRLPAQSIYIPSPLEKRYVPKLLTFIKVFEDISLTDYDCSLTLPRGFPVKQKLRGGECVNFFYKLGENPGLFCDSVKQRSSNSTF